jgi:chromatin remodeling complex protein RSC6
MARGSALNVKMNVSEELYQIVKVDKISRGEMMKKVWAYIKKHDLQDENDKRTIIPDDLLADVIGSRPISMFKMTAKLSEHLS